jgi:hypothetical protein
MTINGMDNGLGSVADGGVVRIDRFARAVLGGEMVCSKLGIFVCFDIAGIVFILP